MIPHSSTSLPDDTSMPDALRVVRERWRVIAWTAVAFAVVAAITALLIPRRYQAAESLLTVSSPRTSSKLSGGGGLAAAASLLGAGIGGDNGLQASPALLVRMALMDGVLREVAYDTLGGKRIIERVERDPLSDISAPKIPDYMRKHVDVNYDRTTGVITVTATHRDSALTRALVTRLVLATRAAFQSANKAQAAELRQAELARVDSADRQLRSAEEAQLAFQQSNRVVSPYSESAVERDRLARNVEIAQSVYRDAVSDRESAIARELEETPAVVVLDGVAPDLRPMSRYVAPATLFAGFMGGVLALAFVLLGDLLSLGTAGSSGEAERRAVTAPAGASAGWSAESQKDRASSGR